MGGFSGVVKLNTASFSGGSTDPHCWSPSCLQSLKRSLTCRESIGRRPLSGMRFWRRTGSFPTAQPLLEVEKQAVADALRRAKGNKTHAAAALGLSRGAFYRRLERFGLVA